MALPAYTTILTNIRTAIQEVERVIEATDTVAFSFYHQAQFPYWTTAITVSTPRKDATNIWSVTLRVQAFLHIGWITEGLDGEVEQRAQAYALLAALTFSERPQLQCTTHPDGVPGISPSGLTVTQAAIGRVDAGENGTRAIIVDMQIPVTFRLDTKG
jgi:hypothetical protein